MIYDISGNAINPISEITKYADDVYFLNAYSETGNMQGGCTDGTYVYFINTSTNNLSKYNVLTGEKTSASFTSGAHGHGNDMTYNPNTNKLYIATMNNDGAIHIINAETLAYEESFSPLNGSGQSFISSGIAYDRKNHQYIITTGGIFDSGHDYLFFDDNWNYKRSMRFVPESRWTYQGVETNGIFIFRPIYYPGNQVIVLDMNGNLQKYIQFPTLSAREVESLAYDWDGVWYALYNQNPSIYYMGIQNTVNSHGVDIINRIMARANA